MNWALIMERSRMMIRFDEEQNRFNYRVVGVAVQDDHVLLHQSEGDEFWAFPGGRAEFGEPAEETLRREMREEIGTEIEVVRLLWLVENFFEYAQRHYHEIALYFFMRLPPAWKHLSRRGPFKGEDEEGTKLIFQWFAREREVLSSLPLLPSFLQTAVLALPESVQHVIHYGE